MRRFPVAVCLVAVLAACPKGKEDPAATLSRVEVTPPTPTIPAGTTLALHATAVYSDGATVDVAESATWSSSAPSVLTVSDVAGSKGVAAGLTGGPATVTATFEGVSGTAAATVVVRTLASLTVAPATVSLPAGQETSLTVTATYDDASTFDVTATAIWTSGSPAAIVSDAAGTKGRVHAVSVGSATITAAFGGQSATAAVTVTPALLESIRVEPLDPEIAEGGGVTLRAFAVFGDATELDVTSTATWTAAPAGVLALAASGGAMRATGLAAGSAVVTATYQGEVAAVTVTVRAAVLQSISVTPVSPATVVGGTVQFVATGTYDDGRVADVTALATWGSTPAGVASVSNDAGTRGRLTGLSVGAASVTATIGTVTSPPVTAQITNLTVAALRLDPAVVKVAPAYSIPLRLIGVDASGAEADLTGVATWTTNASALATVSGGVVTGVAVGTTFVTATRGALSATAEVKVEAAYPVRLLIDAAGEETAGVGAEGQLRAIALYSDRQARDVTRFAAWTSDDTAVVTVTDGPVEEGVVHCVAAGTAHVSASFSGLAATVTFTVTPRRALWINVSTPLSPLPVGVTYPFTAEAVYDDWTSEDVTGVATWSGNGIVTVAPGGVATTVSAGGGLVTATHAGVSGSSFLAVTSEAPAQLIVNMGSAITEGESATWSAKLQYPSTVEHDVTGVTTLSSSDPTVAEIVPDGGYRPTVPYGVAPGTATITFSYGGLTRTATLTVTAPAAPLQAYVYSPLPVGVTVYAGAGAPGVDLSQETQWTSSNPAVLTVVRDADQYVRVTAVAPGTATLTATYGSLTASVAVTVRPRALALVVSPAFATLAESTPPLGGPSQAFTARATLADGTTLDVTGMARWEVGDPAVLRRTGSHSATSARAGTSTFTATLGSLSGSAIVEVTQDIYSSLAFTPVGLYRLPPGVTVRTSVRGTHLYTSGYVTPPLDRVTWSSSNPAVAAFSTAAGHEGELTTAGAGTTTLGATFGGQTANVTLVVDALDSLAVVPPAVGLSAAGVVGVRVHAVFPCAPAPCTAPTFDVAPFLQPWTTTGATIASATLGNVFAGRVGTATLTAHFAGASVDLPVVVVPPSVQSVTVAAPPADGYYVGTHRPVTATALLDNGDGFDVTALATWTESTGGTIAAISGTPPGLDALATGSGTLGADFGGVVGTQSFTVVDTGPAGIDFSPAQLTIAAGTVMPTSIRRLTPYPGAHVGSEAVVSSSDPAVATVAHGTYGLLVHAWGPGSALLTADYRGRRAYAVVNVVAEAGPFTITYPGPYATELRRYQRQTFGAKATLTGLNMGGAAWSSSDPAVARVVSGSVLEAVSPGTTTLTATRDGWSATTEVTVLPTALVALELTEHAVALPVGTGRSLAVLGRYADGGMADLTYAATWWSEAPATADFDPTKPGRLRANAAELTYVEARFAGLTARIPVTVF